MAPCSGLSRGHGLLLERLHVFLLEPGQRELRVELREFLVPRPRGARDYQQLERGGSDA